MISAPRYAAVLGAFGLPRLAELAYSRRNERRIRVRAGPVPQAAAPLFRWIVLTNVGLFSLPVFERLLRGGRVSRLASTIGWVAALSALALRLSVVVSLRGAWTARALVPPDLAVIDRGPYRFIRHPNYVALGLEFAGLPLIGGAYWSAVGLSIINAGLLGGRIAAEERLLDAIPGYHQQMGWKGRFLPRWRTVIAR
ncbi:MAG: isoprenylcysteine carboxylmethyltransferase family protein [Candidatus Dormibacter sp.]